MMKKTSLVLGAALLLSAGAAFAQAPAAPDTARPNRGQRMFEQLDNNRDSRVTWEEAWGFVTGRFNAADADRSGGVSLAEFAAMRGLGRGEGQGRRPESAPPRPDVDPARRAEWQQRMEQRRGMMFRAMDANSDGQVTLAEVQPFAQARFRAMDANADGAVTREELPQRGHGHHHRGPRPDANSSR